MKSPASIFMTHAVTLTDFDKAACIINKGIVERLCIQMKPYYCPTAEWITAFHQHYTHRCASFAITARGVCYLSLDQVNVDIHGLQALMTHLAQVVKQVNVQLGNESILSIVDLADSGMEIREDISGLLDSISWS